MFQRILHSRWTGVLLAVVLVAGFPAGNADAQSSDRVSATYFGGSGYDIGAGAATTPDGFLIVAGQTESADFPLVSPFQGAIAGRRDAFLTKFTPDGQQIIWSTLLGGSGDEVALRAATDEGGSVYVAGRTSSVDFPTTPGAYLETLPGEEAGFVAKFTPNGDLVYSTFIEGRDSAQALAVEGENAYFAGKAGGDVSVGKLNIEGSAIEWITTFGGSANEEAWGLEVDPNGLVVVAGSTSSLDFPLVDPVQSSLGGATDAFLTVLDPSSLSLVFSTYYGGSGAETGHALGLRGDNAYLAGFTTSLDYPTTDGSTNKGSTDVFVTRINLADRVVVYSTLVGGTGREQLGYNHLPVLSDGSLLFSTGTESSDYPTLCSDPSVPGSRSSVAISALSADGELVWSSVEGGDGNDLAVTIDLTADDHIWFVGHTDSITYPTINAYQDDLAGSRDGLLLLMKPELRTSSQIIAGMQTMIASSTDAPSAKRLIKLLDRFEDRARIKDLDQFVKAVNQLERVDVIEEMLASALRTDASCLSDRGSR